MKRSFQNLLVAAVGLFCGIYLLNPDAGIIEFIPDNLPLIGNLDEAAAVLLLLRCLAHFGVDLSFLTRFRKSAAAAAVKPPRSEAGQPRENDVIDV